MKLLDKDGKPTAEIINQEKLAETDTVYNFEVQDFHTYHIGEVGVWVHNADCCNLYQNQVPENLTDELALANRLDVRPISINNTQALDSIINDSHFDGKLKFAITENNELLVMPAHKNGQEISHAVLTNGQPVRAAGEVQIAGSNGQYFGLDLDNHSGHFHFGNTDTQNETIKQISRDVFKEHGIEFLE